MGMICYPGLGSYRCDVGSYCLYRRVVIIVLFYQPMTKNRLRGQFVEMRDDAMRWMSQEQISGCSNSVDSLKELTLSDRNSNCPETKNRTQRYSNDVN
jgi:hypothetical protein